MKVGDLVISGEKKGIVIRFQPKTQDIIVRDEKGILHTFPWSSTVVKNDE
tara:strand:- start:222 stop:371 length:150 start_codon:yes stop_codon:yes gene_type:complete